MHVSANKDIEFINVLVIYMLEITSNIIGLLVLVGWLIFSFSLAFVYRLSRCDRKKFIKILSSPLMYKNTDFKTIVAKNRKALNGIKLLRKEYIYPCVVASVAMFILWLRHWEFPKSIFIFVILALWLGYLTIRTIEYYLDVINKRIENEIIGNNNE